jgi:hypothetical protein
MRTMTLVLLSLLMLAVGLPTLHTSQGSGQVRALDGGSGDPPIPPRK